MNLSRPFISSIVSQAYEVPIAIEFCRVNLCQGRLGRLFPSAHFTRSSSAAYLSYRSRAAAVVVSSVVDIRIF